MNRPSLLILNGSPSPRGNGMALAAAMSAAFDEDREEMNLYDANIGSCRDCGGCRGGDGCGCGMHDGMTVIAGMLAAADAVLVVSPLHFTALSAPVAALYSRFQPFWRARRRGEQLLPEKRRLGALIVTAGSSYRGMYAGARSATAAAFLSIGVEFAGMVTASGTDMLPTSANTAALAEAEALAVEMARRLQL